jgi:hypothetical protein
MVGQPHIGHGEVEQFIADCPIGRTAGLHQEFQRLSAIFVTADIHDMPRQPTLRAKRCLSPLVPVGRRQGALGAGNAREPAALRGLHRTPKLTPSDWTDTGS